MTAIELPPIRKKIRNFSASQISAFSNCQRIWFLRWIVGIQSPQTPAQKRGSEIHDILETYLKTGKIPQTHPLGFYRYIEWLVPFLPDPTKERVASEHKLFLDTATGKAVASYEDCEGIPLVGLIDVGMYDRDPLTIGDLKTTTNFRYAKTPKELAVDTQMNTYAKWAFEVDEELEKARVGHYYVLTGHADKPAVKKPKSKKVHQEFINLSRSHVEEIWQRDCSTMEEMKLVALAPSLEDLPPNINHCNRYGGCQFKEYCGIKSSVSLFANPETTNRKKTDMSFLDKVKKAKSLESKAVSEPATKEEPQAKKSSFAAKVKKTEEEPKKSSFLAKTKKVKEEPSVEQKAAEKADSEPLEEPEEPSIIPPDGASRATSEEESDEIRANAAEKAEKKKSTKKTTTRKSKQKREFTLYIGCVPTKGEHQSYIMVEDWVAQTINELNAKVKEATGHIDFRLTGFSEKQVALAEAISSRLEEEALPAALVAMRSGLGQDIATLLTPYATDVVSAVK